MHVLGTPRRTLLVGLLAVAMLGAMIFGLFSTSASGHSDKGKVTRSCFDNGRYFWCTERRLAIHHHPNGKHYVHDWERSGNCLKTRPGGSPTHYCNYSKWFMRSHSWAGY